jgi:hypothetical protein
MLRGKFRPYGPVKAGLEAMAAGHAKEFDGTGITVNIIVPGGPTDTAVVPASSGLKREVLIPPVLMTYPLLWLCSAEADGVTGKRYVAAKWDPGASIETARNASEGAARLARACDGACLARWHAKGLRKPRASSWHVGKIRGAPAGLNVDSIRQLDGFNRRIGRFWRRWRNLQMARLKIFELLTPDLRRGCADSGLLAASFTRRT